MILALAFPLAVSAVLLAIVFLLLWLDRYRMEPLPWMAAVVAWALAVPCLLLIAASRSPDLLREPSAGRPLPELWLSPVGLAVALAFLGVAVPVGVVARTAVLEGPANGAAFGVAVGLAFSVGMQLLVLARTQLRPAGAALAGVCLVHAAVGATFGAGIGLTRLSARPALRLPGIAAAAAAAVALGALLFLGASSCWTAWGDDEILCNLALAGVAMTILLAIVAVSLSYERRVLAGQLAEEVKLGVLPAWVADLVPSYSRRIRSDWWPRRDERREILRLLVTLAFRKHRLATLPEDRARLYGLEVGRLRHRARVLLVDGAEGVRPRSAAAGEDPGAAS